MNITYNNNEPSINFTYNNIKYTLVDDNSTPNSRSSYICIYRHDPDMMIGRMFGEVEQYKDTEETKFINMMVQMFRLDTVDNPAMSDYYKIECALSSCRDEYKELRRLAAEYRDKYLDKPTSERTVDRILQIRYNKIDRWFDSIKFQVGNIVYVISMQAGMINISTNFINNVRVNDKMMKQHQFYACLETIDSFPEDVVERLKKYEYSQTFTVDDFIKVLFDEIDVSKFTVKKNDGRLTFYTDIDLPVDNMTRILNSTYLKNDFTHPTKLSENTITNFMKNIDGLHMAITDVTEVLNELKLVAKYIK